MSTPRLKIDVLNVEGFRGVNKRVSLQLDGESILIHGGIGAGKTSLLQAIEWCIFGELIYQKADEYKKEDMIVNSYNPDKSAKVGLILKGENGRIIRLIRTRKRGKSSTTGKNPLIMQINDQSLTGDDAERQLAELLRLTPEEYYSRTHLHQETIRDLLFGKIDERSAIIDKMLGLHNIRSIVDSLPLSTVDTKINDLRKDKDGTERQKEDYKKLLAQSRDMINRVSADLMDAKASPDRVDLVFLAQTLSQAESGLQQLADLLQMKIKRVDAPKTLEEAKDIPEVLSRNLSEIEDKRTSTQVGLVNLLRDADQLSVAHKDSFLEMEELKVNPGKIAEEKQKVFSLLIKLNSEKEATEKTHLGMKVEETIAKRLIDDRSRYEAEMDALVRKYGDATRIGNAVKRFEEEMKKAVELIDQQDTIVKLINLGTDYFETLGADTCPVCESKIDVDRVRSSLSRRAKEKKEEALIEKMKEQISQLRQQREDNEKALRSYAEITSSIETNKREVVARKDNLKALGFSTSGTEDPQQQLSYVQVRIKELDKNLLDSRQRILTAEEEKNRLGNLEQKAQTFEQTEKKLQQLLNIRLKGNDLLSKAQEYQKALEERVDDISKLADKAASIRKTVNLMRMTIEYLLKKLDIQNLERTMLPGIQNKLETLVKKLEKVEEMGAALHDIHDAAMSAQEEFLESTLGPLQDIINGFYSRLDPHPDFKKFQLKSEKPEKEKGKYIYRTRVSTPDGAYSAYAQTGLSQGQTHLTAISIFFAIASREPLGFVIVDDPSQSLDLPHKKALASLIAEVGQQNQVLVATQDEQFQEELLKATTKIKPKLLTLGKCTREGLVMDLS